MITEYLLLPNDVSIQTINLIFPLELFFFEFIVLRFSARKNHFVLRTCVVGSVALLYVLFVPLWLATWWIALIYFILMFFVSVWAMSFIFNEKLKHILFYCCSGYCLQNICSNLTWIITSAFAFNTTLYNIIPIIGKLFC